jgi:hypothetical protein
MEDRIKRNKRRWRERNPDYDREYAKRWRERNPDYGREYGRRWRAIPENREKIMEKGLRYRANNREALKLSRGMGISVKAARDLLQAMDGKRGDEMIDISIDTAKELLAAAQKGLETDA